jgi:hypothetical protein
LAASIRVRVFGVVRGSKSVSICGSNQTASQHRHWIRRENIFWLPLRASAAMIENPNDVRPFRASFRKQKFSKSGFIGAHRWLNSGFFGRAFAVAVYYFGDFHFHGLQFLISPANFQGLN